MGWKSRWYITTKASNGGITSIVQLDGDVLHIVSQREALQDQAVVDQHFRKIRQRLRNSSWLTRTAKISDWLLLIPAWMIGKDCYQFFTYDHLDLLSLIFDQWVYWVFAIPSLLLAGARWWIKRQLQSSEFFSAK